VHSKLALTALVAVGMVAPLPAGAAGGEERIAIKDVSYKRPAITVRKGTTVIWNDKDGFTSHTVTSRGRPGFRSSRTLQRGDAFRVTFTRRGRYSYFCRVHPANMRGVVRVN
jgi:plastocyanin